MTSLPGLWLVVDCRSAFPLALAITSCSALAFGRVSVGYRASHIRVRGKKAPVSFWYPATPGRVSKELPYRHFISVAKIVEVLQGTELPGIGWEFRLRAGKPIYPEAQPIPVERQETELQERRLAEGLPRESCAIIFAHGYLGSRFDMLHLCEELAQCGFVVAAPDFAESLSGKVPLREVTRQDIMEELLTRLQKEFAVKHFGIVGHSAGGGTVTWRKWLKEPPCQALTPGAEVLSTFLNRLQPSLNLFVPAQVNHFPPIFKLVLQTPKGFPWWFSVAIGPLGPIGLIFQSNIRPVGLFEASLFPGPFQCGRVAIAGLAPQTVPTDPLLVVASEGDGVVALPRITAALPKNIELQEGGRMGHDGT